VNAMEMVNSRPSMTTNTAKLTTLTRIGAAVQRNPSQIVFHLSLPIHLSSFSLARSARLIHRSSHAHNLMNLTDTNSSLRTAMRRSRAVEIPREMKIRRVESLWLKGAKRKSVKKPRNAEYPRSLIDQNKIEMVYLDRSIDALVQKYACDDNLDRCPVQIV